MIKPPIKNPITAIKEGFCKLLKPVIACPEVHPSAYRVPKPTSKPPITKSRTPFGVVNISKPNISLGTNVDPGFSNPIVFSSAAVFGFKSVPLLFDKY